MLRTRLQFAVVVSMLLAAVALAFHSFIIATITVIALLITIGFGVAFPQLRLFGPFVCRVPQSKKRVALTFDDGPDERSTPSLLELLREQGVKVAFFGIG